MRIFTNLDGSSIRGFYGKLRCLEPDDGLQLTSSFHVHNREEFQQYARSITRQNQIQQKNQGPTQTSKEMKGIP